MTKKDLHIIDSLLERTDNLPNILHLRAAPLDYELTTEDKELLLNTYQKLDDILKEVAAFINVKFPGRQDYIQSCNKIDFDTKIGGMKVITTDREHMKSEWEKGIFDLKSLLKSLKCEVTLLVDIENEKQDNPMFDEKEWDKYFDERLEKRADQADIFLDMILEKGLINLDKITLRKHFKRWFIENHEFDFQIKDGDFSIEDGDIQTVPNFNKNNIPEFLKWFENEAEDFINYLTEHGVSIKEVSKEDIVNHGNMVINKNSKIERQTFRNDKNQKESMWTKANVIIGFIVGLATIIGIIWTIIN